MGKTFFISFFIIQFASIVWAAEPVEELSIIRVTEPSAVMDSAGFSALPVFEMPLSAVVMTSKDIEEKNIHRLSDVTLLDASTTDSYNAAGYWDYLAIRGFTLDNRYNYQRESLPISAATSIPLDNKEKIEILKGLSGLQSGASSPGGQINYVVKRPLNEARQVFRTEFNENGQALVAADAGGRVPSAKQFGYRTNLVHEDIRPSIRDAKGFRSLVSFAGDWRINELSVLETEMEWSQKFQPTQAGMSLLGDELPSVQDPRLNLNNQSWSKPAEFEGLTGTIRYTQGTSSDWSWNFALGIQELKTNDRLAYANGCGSENRFDRYCSNGTFDVYDFRSEGEVKNTYAVRVGLQGEYRLGETTHSTQLGVVGSLTQENYNKQAYNYVGVGTIDGQTVLPENPATLDQNTNREASQYDLQIADAMTRGSWKTWLGARYSFINRASKRTDGSRPVDNSQNFPVPWAALGYEFENFMVYASAGLGVESFVVPNKSGYNNRGEYLSDVTSRQFEVGVKSDKDIRWSVTAFQINRPVVTDQSPFYQVDGEALHRGVESQISTVQGRWNIGASGMLLDAKRESSTLNSGLNGNKPVNVPAYAVRLNTAYAFSNPFGIDALISHEGERAVTADNTIRLPAWTRVDAGLKYKIKFHDAKILWRLSVQNLMDTKYWKESPIQYGHIYLYAGEPRSLWLSMQTTL